MTSLGKSASVGTITCKTLNAKTLNPPLSGVVNPLNADLSLGGNDILGCKNMSCSQINFSTINGQPLGSGTLANPLISALDGNGAGGPYSFENIGVGECATLSSSGTISCGSIDATSGTFTTNTLTTSNNGEITGATTATGLATTNQNSIVKEAGSTVNGNKTTTGAINTQRTTTADSLSVVFDTTLSDITCSGLLTGSSVPALSTEDLDITGDMVVNTNAFIGGLTTTKGKLTTAELQMPIIGVLGSSAIPLDLTGIEGGTINLGNGGKGVCYAYSAIPSPNYPIIFTVQTTQENPARVGLFKVQSQLYQTGAGPFPNLVYSEIETTGLNTVKISCFYDAPSSATTTHRVSVIYYPDNTI